MNEQHSVTPRMKPTKLDRSPLHLLHRAMQQVHDAFSSSVADITPRQLGVLIAIDEHNGASQTDLTERTGIDRTTLGEIIVRLVRRDLVRRRRKGKDRRAYTVVLTEEGRQLLRSAEPLAMSVEEQVLRVLPANRRERFVTLLACVVEKLGSAQKA